MASATLRTALMTAVYAGKTTKNYEGGTKFSLGTGNNGAYIDYLYFSKPMPVGATVLSAKLYLYTDDSTGSAAQTITVKRLKQSVSMTKVTYKTRPTSYYTAPANATATKTAPFPNGTEWVVDVAAHMQSIANGESWFGWELTATSNPNRTVYGPRYKTSALRPRLELVWAMLPTAPASLSPGGGRVVSVTKPTLRATYTDTDADNPLSAIQVQRNTTNDFSGAVLWDSGMVPATSAQLDTSATSWPALSGPLVWWRMRVQDVNGLFSPWSTPESFGYAAKSALTLTSPAPAPNNYVNDDSPPITWTFTGTQTAYQVFLIDPATGTQVWTSGKVTSASTTGFTLPSGYLKSLTTIYRVTVYVWDDKQRETTPTDPAYTQVSQDFSYVLTSSVTPTTGLVATPDPVIPKVLLTWSRATFPDTFTVLRNGVVITSELLPGDVAQTTTTFSWVDPAPLPNVPATYQVTAVVNGKASSGNATSTVTSSTRGVWLADYDRTSEVLIVGRESSRQWSYGEQSEVLEVIGGTQVVVVTHAQRGLEGTITGQLRGGMLGLAQTAADWKAALLAVKKRSGEGGTCWLTAGDATIPVVIRSVNCTPRAEPVPCYDVSFEFYQLDSKVLTPLGPNGSTVYDGNGIPYYSTSA